MSVRLANIPAVHRARRRNGRQIRIKLPQACRHAANLALAAECARTRENGAPAGDDGRVLDESPIRIRLIRLQTRDCQSAVPQRLDVRGMLRESAADIGWPF